MTNKDTIKFCYWHLHASDIEGYACSAHLSEGRCFECRFTIEDIQEDDLGQYVSSKIGSRGIGCCQDFEKYDPEKEAEESLRCSELEEKVNKIKGNSILSGRKINIYFRSKQEGSKP